MKKEYIYIIGLVLCIIAVIYGTVGLVNKAYVIDNEKQESSVRNVYEDTNMVTTASQEEKVSPNADFALKKYFDECSHFDYEEVELPKELVNLTKQEVEDYYDDWEVEEFSSDKIVLCKEMNGYCNQHFLIKFNGDKIAIYQIGRQGELNEYKMTDIDRAYLPEEDVNKLNDGIPVFGEGKLSSVLEDYE